MGKKREFIMYIILYRKPKYQPNSYPWQQNCETANEAYEFVEKLGDDYDFRIFEEIDLGTLIDFTEGD